MTASSWIADEAVKIGFKEGLVSQFLFDDGGMTAEDFCQPRDWFGVFHASTRIA